MNPTGIDNTTIMKNTKNKITYISSDVLGEPGGGTARLLTEITTSDNTGCLQLVVSTEQTWKYGAFTTWRFASTTFYHPRGSR